MSAPQGCYGHSELTERHHREREPYKVPWVVYHLTVGSDVLSTVVSGSGSAYPYGMSSTGRSVLQTEAARPIRSKTSSIDGRSTRWVSQQSSNNFHTLSERPSSSAFSGLEGLPPSKTFDIIMSSGILPKGVVPVRTCAGRIEILGDYVLCGTHLIYHHCHCVYIGFLCWCRLVESELGWKKELRCHERSGRSA